MNVHMYMYNRVDVHANICVYMSIYLYIHTDAHVYANGCKTVRVVTHIFNIPNFTSCF